MKTREKTIKVAIGISMYVLFYIICNKDKILGALIFGTIINVFNVNFYRMNLHQTKKTYQFMIKYYVKPFWKFEVISLSLAITFIDIMLDGKIPTIATVILIFSTFHYLLFLICSIEYMRDEADMTVQDKRKEKIDIFLN
jgi:hypothetical protein